VSFLEVQDLATVAAQTDIASLIAAWCGEFDTVFRILEAAGGVGLIGFVVRRKGRRPD